MTILERRLAKLEQASARQPQQTFCLLVEPSGDTAPDAWNEHRQQIEEAKARGDFVAVVSSCPPSERPIGTKGVNYYPNEFEAFLAEASMLPSQLGNKSLLEDAIKGATCKVWGVVACEDLPTSRR